MNSWEKKKITKAFDEMEPKGHYNSESDESMFDLLIKIAIIIHERDPYFKEMIEADLYNECSKGKSYQGFLKTLVRKQNKS